MISKDGTESVMELDKVHLGDCLRVLQAFPPDSCDLIFTSPPYADNRRKSPYRGVPIDRYVEWFLPIAEELKRVLKPDGSFVLNIKERALHGERQTYVLELILRMKQQGWLWVEEYVWHKKNCYPGRWPNRFRDAWERCLHFTKSKGFNMFQEAVMVPMGAWKQKRLSKIHESDLVRHESRVSSGLGRKVSNWAQRDLAFPTNVLHLPTECSNKSHSATFPKELPVWFIRLFTKEGDVVLDPFMGSGTTAVACILTGRHFVGIELSPEYHRVACQVIEKERLRLPGLGA